MQELMIGKLIFKINYLQKIKQILKFYMLMKKTVQNMK